MTCSAWPVCEQFLFQKEQKSLKIKLNANKLQNKDSVLNSLLKIKKCRGKCSALASELPGQLDILRMRKVEMMPHLSWVLRNLRSLLYFAPDFLSDFQDLYWFSSANRFEINGAKILKDVSFHVPEPQLCLGEMDIVTLLYLTVI